MRGVFAMVFGVIIGMSGAAWAQPGLGHTIVTLSGEAPVAGIFVPGRVQNTCEYKEYWYLFETCPSPYPGSRNPEPRVITPPPQGRTPDYATSLKSFRQHMKRTHPGGRLHDRGHGTRDAVRVQAEFTGKDLI